MIITSSLFEAHLKCPTKCFLRSISETGHGNDYADWVRTKNEQYRDAGVKRLMDEYPNEDCVAGPLDNEHLEAAKWELAMGLVARGQNLESTIHAVERIPSTGRNHTQFIPIRFVPTNKLSKDDKLLLAFDALVLSEVLGQEVALGRIIHGDDQAALKVKTSALAGDARKRLGKIAALLSNSAPPDIALNRHCAECEFRDQCRPKAIEKDDLSLLSSMTGKEREKLNSKGIFTVTQLSHTYRPRKRQRKIKAEKHSPALKALAIREKKIYVTETEKPQLGRVRVFFDVEGIPDRDFYYLIGAKVVDGATQRTYSFWADDSAGEEGVWKEFLAMLAAFDNFSLFHFGSYESEFISRMLKRYGAISEVNADQLKGSAINILTFCYLNIYFPTYSNSLKDLGAYLNFSWASPGSSGLDSIDWRYQWESSKDAVLKERLLRYNLDDCEALKILTGAVLEILTHGTKNQAPVITANSLPIISPYKFGTTSFAVPEFAHINKCAYFNYQRSKVYWRTDDKIKMSLKRAAHQRHRYQRVNKVMHFKMPRYCPACRSIKMNLVRNFERIIYDLRFSSSGVKKWITKMATVWFKCGKCNRYFIPREYVAAISKIMGYEVVYDQIAQPSSRLLRRNHYGSMYKYGHGLLAWTIYQDIGMRQTERNIIRGLNEIFGFGLNPNSGGLLKLKRRAEKFYTEAYFDIVKNIQAGNLVHADETKINLKSTTGYVWVFTNLEEVLYIYSNSREGDMLSEVLQNFKGVLVSDFYAAYDSVPCSQQKCLIHLIRDLNDDLLKNQFDSEFKELVEAFGQLLKAIMATIDAHGLRAHFLRKHKKDAGKFFEACFGRDYSSEMARKYQTRLKKNVGCLFTFLDHDGVPWNNNNAENAIKGFTVLRRAIDGLTTEDGIRPTLKLLSICQTLRNKNISFLDFLKSGERSLSKNLSKVQ